VFAGHDDHLQPPSYPNCRHEPPSPRKPTRASCIFTRPSGSPLSRTGCSAPI